MHMNPRNPLRNARSLCGICQRRLKHDLRPFVEGDHVLLRRTDSRDAPPVLRRLERGRRIETHRGYIQHDQIIGKQARDLVFSQSARSTTEFRAFNVTLEEYVRLTHRLVTPLYGADANLIVSLLDLHPEAADDSTTDEPKLEILEAGTGHGALTLYLSRAIHAANKPRPRHDGADLTAWKTDRRAVVHTIEMSAKHSKHAESVVRGFRRGMYAENVDFHAGDVGKWLSDAANARGSEPFLSHAILDLPGAQDHLAAVSNALRVDGSLVIFKPSITQITDCAMEVKNKKIPLDLSTVIELGVNGGSAGREWDVRFMRPRAIEKLQSPSISGSETSAGGLASDQAEQAPLKPTAQKSDTLHLVCRPKVGHAIVGGGFLGIWRKRRQDN